MALFQDPDDGTSVKVDSVAKAARVIQYDTKGNPITRGFDGDYFGRVLLVPNTLTDNIAFHALYNPTGSGKRVFVRKLEYILSFAGTAAASRSIFKLNRFSGVAPSGGTQVNAPSSDTVLDAVAVGYSYVSDAGIVIAGQESSPLTTMGIQNQLTVAVFGRFDPPEPLVLNPGQGLVVSSSGAIVAGVSMQGTFHWSEGV